MGVEDIMKETFLNNYQPMVTKTKFIKYGSMVNQSRGTVEHYFCFVANQHFVLSERTRRKFLIPTT